MPPKAHPVKQSTLTRESGVPVPVSVILHYLAQHREKTMTTTTDEKATEASTSAPPLEVEVETIQGYIYTGELQEIDEYYNVILRHAEVRRERLFDVSRLACREHELSLLRPFQLSSEPVDSAETTGNSYDTPQSRKGENMSERVRYAGTVMIRSSHLLMIVFEPKAQLASLHGSRRRRRAANATSALFEAPVNPSEEEELARKAEERSPSGLARRRRNSLQNTFRSMATLVKRELEATKKKNREERRKRIEEVKKKTNTSPQDAEKKKK